MILAIDIGNTNIVLGCVEGKKTFFIERLSTDKAKTELEYAVSLKNVLEIYEIPVDQIEGGIINEARLSWGAWTVIFSLPLFSMLVAMQTAYYTVKRTLEKMM